MNAKWILPVAMLALAPGCHRQPAVERQQQNYDVVQEGATSGATSTITAPGEAPPLDVSTTTAADSTTTFTVAPGQTASSPPASMSSTLPAPQRGESRPQPRPYYTPSNERRELRPAPPQTTTDVSENDVSTTGRTSTAEPATSTTTSPTSTDTTGVTPTPRRKSREAPPPPPPPANTTGTFGPR